MSYFSNFPTISYSLDGVNFKNSVNIMRSFKIADYTKENQRSFLDYRIEDGERPDMLAHKAYDRSGYHWIPLIFNDIQDPFYEWPLNYDELQNIVASNYAGMAFFLDVSLAKVFDGDSLVPKSQTFDVSIPHFEVGSKVERVVTTTDPNTRKTTVIREDTFPVAEIVQWNPSFMKLTVKPISGAWDLVGEAKQARDENRPVIINNLSYDIRVRNSRGQDILCPLIRLVEDNRYSIHHFQSEAGNEISPLFNPTNPTEPPTENFRFNSMIYSYVMLGVETFDLSEILPEEGFVSIITNITHEEAKNDQKRAIKMMRPEMIPNMIKEFGNVIGR